MNKRLVTLLLLSSAAAACSSKASTGSGGTSASGGAIGSGGATAGSGGATTGTGGAVSTGGTVSTGGAVGPGGKVGSGGAVSTGGVTTGSGGKGGGGTIGTGTGGAAAGGNTASGGATSTGGAGGSAPVDSSVSVLERNKHPSRDGHFVQPTLTKAMAGKMALDAGFAATFSGKTWASPLFLEKGPGGKGLFFAVTYDNNVFALDETTGATVWMKNIGAPATASIGCGSFASTPNPNGILSTPVIDEQAGIIYVAGAIGDAQGVSATIVTALDVMTGAVKTGWPVDVSAKLSFNPKLHIQRSALSLVNGIVYVAYGGYVGDCGDYRGRVVAIKANDPTAIAGWATGGRGEGIWPAGGMASDGTAVFAATGNTTSGGAARTNSESIVRITGMAAFDKANTKDFFYPSNFASMDSNDADLSSSSPVFFRVPGATPSAMIAAFSKDGNLYFLDSANLGGMGKQLTMTSLSSGTMSLYAVPTVYSTPSGVFMSVVAASGAKCPSGSSGQVMGIAISPGSPATAKVAWCGAATGGSAAISTSTDGQNDAIVWAMSGTKLVAFDGVTGAAITPAPTGTCSNVRQWTSPIAVKGRIVVNGDGHLCSWSAQ